MKILVISNLLLIFTASSVFCQDLSKSLKYAFKKSELDSLYTLLIQWNEEIQSNESEVYDNKYSKAVYSIFNEFYTPFNLKRIGPYEWGDSIYLDKFAIIQNSVKYVIAEFPNPDTIVIPLKEDTLTLTEIEQKYGKEDQIYQLFEDLKYPNTRDLEKVEVTDFRPQTTLPTNKKLYLTTDYRTELLQFLGNQHSPLGFGGIMNPARATKKTWKRQNF